MQVTTWKRATGSFRSIMMDSIPKQSALLPKFLPTPIPFAQEDALEMENVCLATVNALMVMTVQTAQKVSTLISMEKGDCQRKEAYVFIKVTYLGRGKFRRKMSLRVYNLFTRESKEKTKTLIQQPKLNI